MMLGPLSQGLYRNKNTIGLTEGPEEATKRFQQIQEAYSASSSEATLSPLQTTETAYIPPADAEVLSDVQDLRNHFCSIGYSILQQIHFCDVSPHLKERAWYDAHREQILRGDDGPGEEPNNPTIQDSASVIFGILRHSGNVSQDPFKTKINLYKYFSRRPSLYVKCTVDVEV